MLRGFKFCHPSAQERELFLQRIRGLLSQTAFVSASQSEGDQGLKASYLHAALLLDHGAP
eukprot:759281-Hanusia_phi.AAC.6